MIQTLQLILALSFLVIIHEFGHFTFARLFGVRVENFYMFFNYKFSLVRAKKYDGKWHFAFFAPNTTEDDEWGKHPDSTEWGIGWIPFGGYVALPDLDPEGTKGLEGQSGKDAEKASPESAEAAEPPPEIEPPPSP